MLRKRDSGSYAVQITQNFCSDTSACVQIMITGESTKGKNHVVVIYPNPNEGIFTIQNEKRGVYELIDITGKMINTYIITNPNQSIQANLPAGMYFIRETQSGTVQKLIVE